MLVRHEASWTEVMKVVKVVKARIAGRWWSEDQMLM